MAEQLVTQMKELLEKFNSEAEYIHENIKQLKNNDKLTADQLTKKLEDMKQNVTSETHLQSIDNSIEKMNDQYSKSDVISGEELTSTINSNLKNFSTNIVDKLGGVQEKISEITIENEKLVSGLSKMGSYFDDVFSPFSELTDLIGGTFTFLQGAIGGLITLPKIIKGLFSSQKNEQKQLQKQNEQISESTQGNKETSDKSLDVIESLGSDISKMVKSLSGIERDDQYLKRLSKENSETNQTLTEMYSFQREEQKRDIRKDDESQGLFDGIFVGLADGFVTIVGAALLTLGVTIGAALRSILLPFELIGKAVIKFTPIAKWFSNIIEGVTSILTKMPSGTKILGYMQKAIESVKKMFGFITGLKNSTGLLGKLVQGVSKGFSKLFLPLTVIMGVIDFVKGFMSEQGSIIDKIKGGLQEVVSGFIELPVKLLGWITDWVLGLFGTEIKGGSASKIMDAVDKVTGFIFDTIMWPINAVMGFLEGFSSEQGSFIDKIGSGISKAITNIASIPINFLGWIVDGIVGLFGADIDSAKAVMSGIKILVDSAIDNILWPFKKIKELLPLMIEGISNIVSDVIDFFKNIIPSWEQIKSLITVSIDWWKDVLIDPISNIVSDVIDFFKNLIPSWDDIKGKIRSIIPKGTPNWLLPDFLENKEQQKFKPSKFIQKAEDRETDSITGGFRGIKKIKKQDKDLINDWVGLQKLTAPQLNSILQQSDLNQKDEVNLKNLIKQKENSDISDYQSVITKTDPSSEIEQMEKMQSQQKKKESEEIKKLRESVDRSIKNTQNLQKNIIENNNKTENNTRNEATQQDQQPSFPNKDIPDEIENLSLFLFNKNWGVV